MAMVYYQVILILKTLGELYGKVPEIWKRMADDHGYVNSNYGYQWGRNSQLRL